MYCIAEKVKKTKLFQKPFAAEGDKMLITDTKRCKEKFLRSDIKNVVFGKEFSEDPVFGEKIVPMRRYDADFLLAYLEPLIENIALFLKIEFPVEQIALFGDSGYEILGKYAKMVTVIGEGEGCMSEGVYVRHSKKLKSIPDIAVMVDDKNSMFLPGVPCIDLRREPQDGPLVSSWKNLSFKCSLMESEICAETMMYIASLPENVAYSLTSCRKKSPLFFTFG